MKADDETKEIPIIAVTVVPRTSARVHGLEVDDYVTKPFAPEDLVQRVTTALKVAA
jgi:DNA-binding response OmpR family regulator